MERELQKIHSGSINFPIGGVQWSKVAMNNSSNHRHVILNNASLTSLANKQLYSFQNGSGGDGDGDGDGVLVTRLESD